MNKKNLIVGQSGGPTAVINSSLYGVVCKGLQENERIGNMYGMVNGIEGLLKATPNIINFYNDHTLQDLMLLTTTPGSFLGSCRYKLPENLDDSVYSDIFRKLQELNIGYFLYIGGNDSMDTVSKLSRYAKMINSDILFIGVPKTIDNDLILTDHTPGFGSAARYIASTVREIVIDASVYSTQSVTIVEIMGRHAGWLAASSILARKYVGDNPMLVYLPESDFSTDKFLKQIIDALKVNNTVVVCVSEGIKDSKGKFICEYDTATGTDAFGHKMLAGCGKYLENLVRKELGIKARSIELNVCQRCSSMIMSQRDREEAILAGEYGVSQILNGETGKMVSFIRSKDADYSLSYGLEDVNKICNKEKTVPSQWIIKDGSDVDSEFINYALPLIQGKVEVPLNEDGLPKYLYRK